MMVSNRSIITTLYREEKEDGEKALWHSSLGNDEIAASRATEIGYDVIMNMIVAYWSFKPMEGGVDITYVVTADIAGMIPGFVKT